MRAPTYKRPTVPSIPWPRALKPLVGVKITYHSIGSLLPNTATVLEIKKRNILLSNGEWIHTNSHELEEILL